MKTPVVTIATAAIVAASALTLPDRCLKGESVAADFVGRVVLGRARANRCVIDTNIYLVREDNGFRVIDTDEDSWNELAALSQSRPRDVFTITHRTTTSRRGVWAITRWSTKDLLFIQPMGGSLTDEESSSFRAFGAAALGKKLGADLSFLAAADRGESWIVWKGYLENAAVAVSAPVFVLSLGWVPGAWRRLINCGPRGRMRRGLCPSCGYPVVGLPSGTCPECGRPVVMVSQRKGPGAGPGP